MFGRMLSVNPGNPDLYYDLSQSHRAFFSSVGVRVTDLSGHNRNAWTNNFTVKSPTHESVSFNSIAGHVDATIDGFVCHITKLYAPDGSEGQYDVLSFDIPSNPAFATGDTLFVYVQSPAGKVITDRPYFRFVNSSDHEISENNRVRFQCNFFSGADVAYFRSNSPVKAYLALPESFWDKDSSGSPIDTTRSFYIAIPYVYDKSHVNGMLDPGLSKFQYWNYLGSPVIEGNMVNLSDSDLNDFYYEPTKIYDNGEIMIWSGFEIAAAYLQGKDVAYIVEVCRKDNGSSLGYSLSTDFDNGTTYFVAPYLWTKTTTAEVSFRFKFRKAGTYIQLPLYHDTLFSTGDPSNIANIARYATQAVTDAPGVACNTIVATFKNTDTDKKVIILKNSPASDSNESFLGLYLDKTAAGTNPAFDNSWCNGDKVKDGISYYNGRRQLSNGVKDSAIGGNKVYAAVVNFSDVDIVGTDYPYLISDQNMGSFKGEFYSLVGYNKPLTTWQVQHVQQNYIDRHGEAGTGAMRPSILWTDECWEYGGSGAVSTDSTSTLLTITQITGSYPGAIVSYKYGFIPPDRVRFRVSLPATSCISEVVVQTITEDTVFTEGTSEKTIYNIMQDIGSILSIKLTYKSGQTQSNDPILIEILPITM